MATGSMAVRRAPRADVPQPFRVRFDPKREEWAVLQGERWRFAKEVCVQVAVLPEPSVTVQVTVVLPSGYVVDA